MSNHSGDTNKMVGETPRTDARVKQMIDNDQGPEGLEHWARDLERELNAANKRIKQLEDARTVAAANSLANMLAYEDAVAKIKRLEEAGDRMKTWLRGDARNGSKELSALRQWRKSKEAKP